MEKDSTLPIPEGYTPIKPELPNLAALSIIAERARREGFIAIQDIAAILSSDDSYADQLRSYGKNIRSASARNIRMTSPRRKAGSASVTPCLSDGQGGRLLLYPGGCVRSTCYVPIRMIPYKVTTLPLMELITIPIMSCSRRSEAISRTT
jgi:hypothetical protein